MNGLSVTNDPTEQGTVDCDGLESPSAKAIDAMLRALCPVVQQLGYPSHTVQTGDGGISATWIVDKTSITIEISRDGSAEQRCFDGSSLTYRAPVNGLSVRTE